MAATWPLGFVLRGHTLTLWLLQDINFGCNLANSLELANHQLSDLFAPFTAGNACGPNAPTRQATDSAQLCRMASDAMPFPAFATDVFN